MNIKQKILSALLLTALSAATCAQENKKIEVNVDTVNGHTVKTVTVNGKELSDDEIAQMEADGELKVLHLDSNVNNHKELNKMILVHAGDNTNGVNQELKDISINVNTVDGITTKTITVDGKELSEDEFIELEAKGQVQSFNMDSDDGSMQKMIFIKSDDENGTGSLNENVKVITKSLHFDSDNNATLGFMANIKDDGWHVISVINGSGAQDAGLQPEDVIKTMDSVDLTNKIDDVQEIVDLTQRQAGDFIELEVMRGDSLITLNVEAKLNDSADVIINNNNGEQNVVMLNDANMDLSKKISVMVMNGEDMDFDFDENDINVVFPDNINELKMFISQGDSTAKLLGENNKLSSLSPGLSEYFNTDGGVLVLKAGDDNVFRLEDGDVIKNIDGIIVKSPKDVIKQLLKADKQEDIKLKIVRHKRNKTLKYNK